ncbi:P-loop containing nucleoside triphosphate hydrolase protein [Hypoxylon cercidicola]|nr:P-loop containing nucleoside triphosphate hydrolase protein [Hypoxylon cercidicola]
MAKSQDRIDINPGSLFDHRQVRLFDSLHQLSRLEMPGGIETPQLIVVGSQSSGKSSVLESLVRFHFPVDGRNPTTRFPIKLVLRTAEDEATRVRIEPGSLRSEEHTRSLHNLAEELSGNIMEQIMMKANAALRVSSSDTEDAAAGNFQTFCEDVLVIERHGPSLPNLSLIDLPGLFDAATEGQTHDDKEIVENMVSGYIKSPKNIILLVISAEYNDYANATTVGFIQKKLEKDRSIERRLVCVVTRPDTAASLNATLGVLGEKSQFSRHFSRPWHVVRNQDHTARERRQSLDERDLIEESFFAGSDWETVSPSQKGIRSLRETLKSMIVSHTQDQLPGIISEIKKRIKSTEASLSSAIRERATPETRRAYLGDIAEKFALLTREAVKGTYENEACRKDHETGEECGDCKGFFGPFGNDNKEYQQKRLRANVRALNQAFAIAMRQYGRTTVEVGNEGTMAQTAYSLHPMSPQCDKPELRFQPPGTVDYYKHSKPKPQSREKYEVWVRENIAQWKSKGPWEEPSDGAYSGLFAYQAEKWEKIASEHMKAVWKVVKEFIELTLEASCKDEDVLAGLRRRLLKPNLKKLELEADRTLRDLVSCHRQSNPGFYDSLIEARAMREHTRALLERMATTKLEAEDSTDVNGANSQRSADQRAKDRNQKREAMLKGVLELAIPAIAGFYTPSGNKQIDLLQEFVFPFLTSRIMAAFDDSNRKEKAGQTDARIQNTVQNLYPANPEDLAAARVIEQVELHYEGIRASFVGYVASLVVERKITGQLSTKILTMTLVRDMDEEVVEDIAAEKPEVAKKRDDIQRDLETMKRVLGVVEDYGNPSQHIAL